MRSRKVLAPPGAVHDRVTLQGGPHELPHGAHVEPDGTWVVRQQSFCDQAGAKSRWSGID